MTTRAQYLDPQAADIENFTDSMYDRARNGSDATLDSAAMSATNADLITSDNLPTEIAETIALMPEAERTRVLDAIVYGADVFNREHGFMPTADLIQAALQQGRSAAHRFDAAGRHMLDSVGTAGSTDHHDQISSQPNRIVVAITSAIAEAIPFATYLPTDIGSNEARLGIVSHQAGSQFGDYVVGELMDGINVGKPYISSERRVILTKAGDLLSATGKITGRTGGSENTPLLRGRTIVYVNGFPVAFESHNTASSAANSPISGTVNISGTDYAISGTVTVATGAVALAFAPALPNANVVVEVEGFIDFEVAPELAPRVITQVQTYRLFANPWRVLADQTIDSKTQYQNELSLDLQSENLIAIRNQFGMERHYMTLAKLKALAVSNQRTYDFDWTGQKSDKTRARIWQDFIAVLGIADQVMAEDTMDHGITHLYVTKTLMAQFMTLPTDIFVPSGITARPSIFRVGTLFKKFEVYYTPKGLTEGGGSAQMLCIGRSPQVARCPVVLGDAVAPTYLPLAMGNDMKTRSAFYARNFTSVNPHQPSARGAALITVTNLGM